MWGVKLEALNNPRGGWIVARHAEKEPGVNTADYRDLRKKPFTSGYFEINCVGTWKLYASKCTRIRNLPGQFRLPSVSNPSPALSERLLKLHTTRALDSHLNYNSNKVSILIRKEENPSQTHENNGRNRNGPSVACTAVTY